MTRLPDENSSLVCAHAELISDAEVMSLLIGEGSEEIGNMIQNYIKEIEELR